MGTKSDAVRVGLVVLFALALIVGAGTMLRADIFRRSGKTAYYVDFRDGLGLRPGMPVKLVSGADAGYLAGLPVAEQGGLVSRVRIWLNQGISMHQDWRITITQDGLLGEKFLVINTDKDPDGRSPVLPEGSVIPGGREEFFSKIIGSASEGLSSSLDSGPIGETFDSLQSSLGKVDNLMGRVDSLMLENEGYISASMKNVEVITQNFLSLSKNLEQASRDVQKLAADPIYRDSVSEVSDNLRTVSDRMEHLTGTIDELLSDPELQQNTKDSMRLTRETLEETKKTIERFQQTMDKVDNLLDKGGALMESADGLVNEASGTLTDVKGKIDSFSSIGNGVDFSLGLNVRARDADRDEQLGNADKYVGDLNAAIGFDDKYVQVGADNIGEENDWNFLLGLGPLDGLSLKGGVYRGELGVGARWRTGKNSGGADVMLYDTEDPKLNAYGYLPVGDAVNVIVGVEDAQNDAQATVGVGVELN